MNTNKAFRNGAFAVLIALAFAALSLAGCGNSTGGPEHTHQWGLWTVNEPATCTTIGQRTRTCAFDATHIEAENIPIDDDAHEWGENTVEKTAPACEEDGEETLTCTRDSSHTDIRPIPAYGHDWDRTIITAPAETTDGEESVLCKNDPSHAQTRTAYATGTAGLVFELIDENTAYRVRKGTVTTGAVHIPAYHLYDVNNYYLPITEIGSASDGNNEGAFQSTSITAVTIPAGVTSIGGRAFASCRSLTGITFAADSQLETIGFEAFSSSGLTSITLPAGVTSIGGLAFSGCSSLTSIEIPAGVTSIGGRAFEYCRSLTGIIFAADSQLETIGSGAFWNCSGLTSITIPAGVTSIGSANYLDSISSAFSGCTGLTNITVDGNNPNYASEGGVLYNKAKTTLLRAPEGIASVTIPASVTSIGDYSFQDCTSLTGVNIPASVTTIRYNAFDGCTGLTGITVGSANPHFSSEGGIVYNKAKTQMVICPPGISGTVTIPAFVTSIGSYTFQYCTGLTSITIPESVTIGYAAFAGWTALQTIIIQGKADQAEADAAWGAGWRASCRAAIDYHGQHNWGAWTEKTAPAESTNGEETRTCPHNGSPHSETRTAYATGTPGLDIEFANENNTTVCRVRKGSVESGVVYIPGYYRPNAESPYLPVTVGAFSNTNITAVHLLEGVTSISRSAFSGCSSLTSITIPAGVTSIGIYAFDGCNSLTSITIPASVTSINSVELVFRSSSLSSITVEANNPNYASQDGILYNKEKTTMLLVPEGISGNVTLPASVTSIGENSFQYRDSLTGITVEANNPNYASQDGILYNKEKTTFIHIPRRISGNVTIPAGITSIGDSAFSGRTGLTSITLPAGVTSIGNYAFYGCSSLTSIEIPASVTSIGYYAFSGWQNTQTINVPFANAGAQPAGWDSNWNGGSAAIVYQGG